MKPMSRTLLSLVVCWSFLQCALVGADTQLSIQVDADGESHASGASAMGINPDLPEFVPTKEWQEILDGQVVPAGLHYRMDLTEEKKYAKLMPGGYVPESSGKGLVVVAPPQDGTDKDTVSGDKEPQKIKRGKPFFDAAIAERVLVGLPHPEPSLLEALSSRNKMSKEDLDELIQKVWEGRQREIAAAAAKIVSYADAVAKILNDLKPQESGDETGRIVALLTELEYHLCDIDIAGDFRKMGGFLPVVQFLNSSAPEIQRAAAWVVGSASKTIRPSQEAAAELGAIPLLLQMATGSGSGGGERQKALYALGALLRHHVGTQAQFRQLGGSEALANIVRQLIEPPTSLHQSEAAKLASADTLKLLSKVAALAGDFMDAEDTLLRTEFRTHAWCELLLQSGKHVSDEFVRAQSAIPKEAADSLLSLQMASANAHEKIFQALTKVHAGGSCGAATVTGPGAAQLKRTLGMYRAWDTDADFKETGWSDSIVSLIQSLRSEIKPSN